MECTDLLILDPKHRSSYEHAGCCWVDSGYFVCDIEVTDCHTKRWTGQERFNCSSKSMNMLPVLTVHSSVCIEYECFVSWYTHGILVVHGMHFVPPFANQLVSASPMSVYLDVWHVFQQDCNQLGGKALSSVIDCLLMLVNTVLNIDTADWIRHGKGLCL